MNKKGFTLIELLAIIVILGIIITVVATKGFGAFDNSKKKIYELEKKAIEEAVSIYMTDIKNCNNILDSDSSFLEGTNCENLQEEALGSNGVKITLKDLIEKEYIKGNNVETINEYNPNLQYKGKLNKEDNEDIINSEIIVECITDCEFKTETTTINPETTLVDCYDYNTYMKSLTCTVMNDERITKNTNPATFNGVATSELGMYSAEDDYGSSWYFRGAQPNNYVSFAGFIWRIVRINGDGSVRMILDGSLDKVKRIGETNFAGSTSTINQTINDNTFLGYMYGIANGTNYKDTHKNLNDSIIKISLDKFYETYIENSEKNYHFQKYLADVIFCNDKTRALGYIDKGYGQEKTYYSAYDRLYKNTVSTPSLKCVSRDIISDINLTEEELAYSRYTSNIDLTSTTNKGVLVNNDLKYPIALLSADEMVMAGAFRKKQNKNYYLHSSVSYDKWWTLTPYYYNKSDFNAHYFSNEMNYTISMQIMISFGYGVRPVINLKKEVLINDGNGTVDNPYTVKIN